jgi:putative membrane-bound dehydrogenase-like protein
MFRSQLFNILAIIVFLTACSGERSSSEDYSEDQRTSPLTPEEQLETFQLPEGFEIELVASDPDLANVITVSFDDKGRMWAVTAQEYPLDGNEQPESARMLYELGGRDRVLVFDTPTEPGRQVPRTFVDSLAMPMAVLPVGDDILVAQGPDILRYRDTNGDGKADEKEVLLTGFGIQDSHLMPHGFTRGPGDWIYFAQGAFNYSNVETKEGTVEPFNFAKIGRFQPDGTNFEVVGAGLNNIWGFVIDRHGEMFIQEANDLGYPVVPFFIGANYPGIGFDKLKPYAPWQPPVFDDFTMGGTGLSGLALAEDIDGFPEPYQGVMYLANPITRKINAARIHEEGTGYKMEHLPDFLESTDEWFRPIAIHFGPDDCLYIVDWYNKIIAHNEVPRDHPERDQEHGRIWRVCPADTGTRDIPDLTQVEQRELLTHLDAKNTWEGRAAWFQIVERAAVHLAPELRELTLSPENALDLRLRALWSLEGLYEVDYELVEQLIQDEHRAMRREAVRVISALDFEREKVHLLVEQLTDDPDPQVRAEVIRSLDSIAQPDNQTMDLLARMGRGPLDGERKVSIQGNRVMKAGEAGDRDFERYLARAALEKHPRLVKAFLESQKGEDMPAENRMLAILSLDSASQRMMLAPAVASLDRPLIDEELVVLSNYLDHELVYPRG